MDRDKRWERVEVAMNAMCVGDGEETSDPIKTIKERYEKGETDEFLKPIIVGGKEARIKGSCFPLLSEAIINCSRSRPSNVL